MWPDTWSGQKRILFFSLSGCEREWTLPVGWADVAEAATYPLTPAGRGDAVVLPIRNRAVKMHLLPETPYVLVPCEQ